MHICLLHILVILSYVIIQYKLAFQISTSNTRQNENNCWNYEFEYIVLSTSLMFIFLILIASGPFG